MASFKRSEAALRRIMDRQWKNKWGADYEATICATPKEAPGCSQATILYPQKLGGRAFHALSNNEKWASLFALYNPDVWEIHEQKVLYPQPRAHFLYGHHMAAGIQFKPIKGTLDVCERMGAVDKHAKCRVQLDGEESYAPFPYVGDLLLFMKDRDGVYCVNWTIKDKFESFRRRGPNSFKPPSDEDDMNAIRRHAMEEIYYEDLGVPTRQIVGRQVDLQLRANLNDLFLSHAIKIDLPDEVQQSIVRILKGEVGGSTPVYVLIRDMAARINVEPIVVKNVLIQAIWNRKIRVDMYRPILMDRPLRPEVKDPLVDYQDWFVRG
jgi:hypothetical protein